MSVQVCNVLRTRVNGAQGTMELTCICKKTKSDDIVKNHNLAVLTDIGLFNCCVY